MRLVFRIVGAVAIVVLVLAAIPNFRRAQVVESPTQNTNDLLHWSTARTPTPHQQ